MSPSSMGVVPPLVKRTSAASLIRTRRVDSLTGKPLWMVTSSMCQSHTLPSPLSIRNSTCMLPTGIIRASCLQISWGSEEENDSTVLPSTITEPISPGSLKLTLCQKVKTADGASERFIAGVINDSTVPGSAPERSLFQHHVPLGRGPPG